MATKKELDEFKEIIKELKGIMYKKTKVKEESKAPTKSSFSLDVKVEIEDGILVKDGAKIKADTTDMTNKDVMFILSSIVCSCIASRKHSGNTGLTEKREKEYLIKKFKETFDRSSKSILGMFE